ncbi:unnamed protein product [Discosporangium mesarthrocarpum]
MTLPTVPPLRQRKQSGTTGDRSLEGGAAAQASKAADKEVPPPSPSSSSSPPKRKLSNKEKYEYERLEGEIESLSRRAKELEDLLANAHQLGTGFTEMTGWSNELTQVGREAEEKTERWLELAEIVG